MQCAIFEDNQRDLEMSVEQLSGYLEGDVPMEDITVLRQTVHVLWVLGWPF